MRAMLEQTLASGAKGVVLLPPYSASLLERHPTIPRYQEILQRTAKEFGVVHSPLQVLFEAASGDEGDLYLEHDDFHPNRSGHRLIGEEIGRSVAKVLDGEQKTKVDPKRKARQRRTRSEIQ
jgi:lysophospholipase L1-like esterase